MTSLKQKKVRLAPQKLQAEDTDEFVSELFSLLIHGDKEDKAFVRGCTANLWFTAESILKLYAKISGENAGWGRAKRSAISAWYLKRPLIHTRNQILEMWSLDTGVTHSTVCCKLHMSEQCRDPTRQAYLKRIESNFGAGTNDGEKNKKQKKGWLARILGAIFSG
jgi:hypothetical protein